MLEILLIYKRDGEYFIRLLILEAHYRSVKMAIQLDASFVSEIEGVSTSE